MRKKDGKKGKQPAEKTRAKPKEDEVVASQRKKTSTDQIILQVKEKKEDHEPLTEGCSSPYFAGFPQSFAGSSERPVSVEQSPTQKRQSYLTCCFFVSFSAFISFAFIAKYARQSSSLPPFPLSPFTTPANPFPKFRASVRVQGHEVNSKLIEIHKTLSHTRRRKHYKIYSCEIRGNLSKSAVRVVLALLFINDSSVFQFSMTVVVDRRLVASDPELLMASRVRDCKE